MPQKIREKFWEIIQVLSFGLVRENERELMSLIVFTYGTMIAILLLVLFGTNRPTG